jgi:hypothetical protein
MSHTHQANNLSAFVQSGQDKVGLNKNTGKWFDVFEERRFQFVCQERVWQCVSKVFISFNTVFHE